MWFLETKVCPLFPYHPISAILSLFGQFLTTCVEPYENVSHTLNHPPYPNITAIKGKTHMSTTHPHQQVSNRQTRTVAAYNRLLRLINPRWLVITTTTMDRTVVKTRPELEPGIMNMGTSGSRLGNKRDWRERQTVGLDKLHRLMIRPVSLLHVSTSTTCRE